ncbi:methyl-accepting chemotaxis protein, partial [Blastococcus sp. MG754426]
MDHAHDPAATAEPGTGETRRGVSGIGLRGRLLGSILVVALTTVGVGAFGIQRMSVISDQAQQVYDRGAVPLSALEKLETDWWKLSTNVARAAIPT